MKATCFKMIILFLFIAIANLASEQKVTLDTYFNHETRLTKDGRSERFHYLWNETANTGFSIWGEAFKSLGATLDTLGEAPTLENLHNSSVYIIVDPDSEKENPHPIYITGKDANATAAWVKQGGILVMMANDSANVELPHFNILAAKFGLHFNNDLQNHVADDAHLSDGAIITNNSKIFTPARKIFIKDACSISYPKTATPIFASASGAAIAVSLKYGKGAVFAVGDPWLYNEYVNGRLPAGYENDKAVLELSSWLLKQANRKK